MPTTNMAMMRPKNPPEPMPTVFTGCPSGAGVVVD